MLLLLPMLVLLGAGVAWLWQKGWLLWWLLAAASLTLLTWSALRLRHGPKRSRPVDSERPALTEADSTWAPQEQAAWEAVRRLSSTADPGLLDAHERMLEAAQRTFEEVARHYHPEQEDPALEFTLPELLLLTERVSARLRLVLLEHVPLSHRLRARSVIRAWGYRPLLAAGFEHGRKLYSIVRIARAVSPLHAIAAEVRDRLIGDLFDNVHTNVRRRIVRLWIEEVGRAAIELYSGRLRIDAQALAQAAASEGLRGAATTVAPPGSLRVLVAGRTNAGKSTLVNAMLGALGAGVEVRPFTGEFHGYELREAGLPPAYLIDSPGIDDEPSMLEFVKRAFACDLVIWVAAAHETPTLDGAALEALRARFAAHPQRRMPPVIVVASHIDRVGATVVAAPEGFADASSATTEDAVRDTLEALAEALEVAPESIVPMRLDARPAENLDLLWQRVEASIDEAQRARWVRVLRGTVERRAWRTPWRQTVGAGRMLRRLLKRR